jgi:(R,R)-butanediol dehydrogenase/meso-butanediol dehydrogenase/diacetyl reductase
MNLLGVLAHEKEIVGSSAYVDEFPEAMDLLARGRVRLDPLITDRVPLQDALARGLEALVRRETRHVKVLIKPS